MRWVASVCAGSPLISLKSCAGQQVGYGNYGMELREIEYDTILTMTAAVCFPKAIDDSRLFACCFISFRQSNLTTFQLDLHTLAGGRI
jgi:hypothetical protein